MNTSSPRLVLIQDDRLARIAAGSVEPHIAFALWLLARLVEYLQRGFICMKNIPVEKPPVQPFVDGRQIILACPQDPVGHGLSAQGNALTIQLLLLTVQRTTHNELLGHDVGNSLRRGKTAGDNALFVGSLDHRRLDVLLVALPAGIAVIDMLLDNGLGRNDFKLVDHLGADLGHDVAALGAYQILALQTVLDPFSGHFFRNGIQGVLVLPVPLVGSHDGGILLILDGGEHLCLVEQEAQLLHEGILTLLRGCAELLVPGQAQCFHKQIHTAFELRNTLALSLKLLVFRTGNGDHFRVT